MNRFVFSDWVSRLASKSAVSLKMTLSRMSLPPSLPKIKDVPHQTMQGFIFICVLRVISFLGFYFIRYSVAHLIIK